MLEQPAPDVLRMQGEWQTRSARQLVLLDDVADAGFSTSAFGLLLPEGCQFAPKGDQVPQLPVHGSELLVQDFYHLVTWLVATVTQGEDLCDFGKGEADCFGLRDEPEPLALPVGIRRDKETEIGIVW